MVKILLRKMFVDNAKIVVPLLTSIPGAGIMYMEVSDHLDDLPETVFDSGTFILALIACLGYAGEKLVKRYMPPKVST